MGQLSERLLISGLTLVPKNAMSRLVGGIAHIKLPGPLRRSVIRSFARMYDIDLNEAESGIHEYPSVGEFFTRRLKVGSRSVDYRPGHVVSPADGKILNSGKIENGTLIQAKGRDFTVADLLGSEDDAVRFDGGSWITVYLSPRDYHRVHHPVEGTISMARYLPGRLWPVNQAAVNHVDRLFCVNERLVTFVDSPLGRVATVMVGATSVGQITVSYDRALKTNQNRRGGDYHYPSKPRVARSDELGIFHLGSTAIVLIESPDVSLESLEEGQAIRMGQSIGRLSKKS